MDRARALRKAIDQEMACSAAQDIFDKSPVTGPVESGTFGSVSTCYSDTGVYLLLDKSACCRRQAYQLAEGPEFDRACPWPQATSNRLILDNIIPGQSTVRWFTERGASLIGNALLSAQSRDDTEFR
jgi:hypothetical protein